MSETGNALSTEYMLRELQNGIPGCGEIYIKDILKRFDLIQGQIDKLAKFITDKVPGEPSKSEGAIDTAIRVLGDLILTSHILLPKKDAEMVQGAIARADCFFRCRDKMNAHLHLEMPKKSPLAKEVARGLQIMSAHVYPREDLGQESGS